MSRHRNLHNMDYDDYYDDDYDDYHGGDSYGDHHSLSPSVQHYVYNADRSQQTYAFDVQSKGKGKGKEDKRTKECVDEVLGFVGDGGFSREYVAEILQSVNFNIDDAVNLLLDEIADANASQTQEKGEKNSNGDDLGLLFDLELDDNPPLSEKQVIGKADGKNVTPSTSSQGTKPSSIAQVLAEDDFNNMPPSSTQKTLTSISTLTSPPSSDISPFKFDKPSPDDTEREKKRVHVRANHHSASTVVHKGDMPKFPLKDVDPAITVTKSLAPVEEKKMETVGTTLKKLKNRKKLMDEMKSQNLKPNINMVVVGHVDAGKSTLMGHLLYLKGCVSQKDMHKFERESKQRGKPSFAYAWVLDAHEEERDRGVTVDVGKRHFETETRRITLLDSPGHRDFIPNMITGAAQADVAVLVIGASRGEFESGFNQDSGQTQEHAILVKSLGVTQMIVAVNKMDTMDWKQERFDQITSKVTKFLKKQKYKSKNLKFVPCSGMTGENIVEPVKDSRLDWYKGKTLMQYIDDFKPPTHDVDAPFRMSISDVFKSQMLGVTVSGRVESGSATIGDMVYVMPCLLSATIKGLSKNEQSSKIVCAGEYVDIGLSGLDDASILRAGQILCDVDKPVPLVQKFKAKIVTLEIKKPLLQGQDLILHIHCIDEPVKITKLGKLIDKKTGELSKKKTRCITSRSTCDVTIAASRAVCVDTYKNAKKFGRFFLRRGGRTVAVGMVTKILEEKVSKSPLPGKSPRPGRSPVPPE